MIRYGAKSLPYGGWWAIPPLAGDGWMILGRLGGLPEFAAAQGHSSGDQERNAGGGDGFRSADEGDASAASLGAVSEEESNPAGSRTNSGRYATSIRALRTGFFAGHVPRRLAAVHRRPRPAATAIRQRRPRAHEEARRVALLTAAPKLTCSARPRVTASSPSTSSPTCITPARSTKKISPRIWSSTTPTSAIRAA